MPATTIPLEYDTYYHIYNRGIDGCNLYREINDYKRFLRLYEKHIDPISDTFAWILMPNHFHLLVRIKSEEEISKQYTKPDRLNNQDASKPVWLDDDDDNLVKLKPPHQHFSNLCNAYSKYINIKYQRTGSLFERPFKRKQVSDDQYFRNVVLYIHNNPIHHGFTDIAVDYPWSSYLTSLSVKPTKLKREEVIEWFNDQSNFKFMHQQHVDFMEMDNWLEI